MPLSRVVFADQSGARVQMHIRAPVAADHITLAVQKISHSPDSYETKTPLYRSGRKKTP
jgi:hypothetical protein